MFPTHRIAVLIIICIAALFALTVFLSARALYTLATSVDVVEAVTSDLTPAGKRGSAVHKCANLADRGACRRHKQELREQRRELRLKMERQFKRWLRRAKTEIRRALHWYAVNELRKGVHEYPLGSNAGGRVTTYTSVTGVGHSPWCASFVAYLVRKAEAVHPLPPYAASVSSWAACIRNGARGLKRVYASTPVRAGDIVVFCGHIGVVHRWQGRSFVSIEGNVSDRLKLVKHRVGEALMFGRVLPARVPARLFALSI